MTYSALTPEEAKAGKTIHDFMGCIGIGYSLGAVGGSLSHFFKSFRHSPNGQRLKSGFHSARMNAPRCATTFAFWTGGVYTAFEFTLESLRQKDDSWNCIIGGTFTGMLYNMHRGLARASKTGIICATTISFLDVFTFVNRKVGESYDEQIASGKEVLELDTLQPMLDGTALWFKILMDGGGEEKPEDLSTQK